MFKKISLNPDLLNTNSTKWIIDPNVIHKPIEFVEENIENICDLELSEDLLGHKKLVS